MAETTEKKKRDTKSVTVSAKGLERIEQLRDLLQKRIAENGGMDVHLDNQQIVDKALADCIAKFHWPEPPQAVNPARV